MIPPGVRTCSPFEEGILHLWMGGGGVPPVGLGVKRAPPPPKKNSTGGEGEGGGGMNDMK